MLRGITAEGAGVTRKPAELGDIIGRLSPRWFLIRSTHLEPGTLLVQPRWAMTYLRGPMTRHEIKRARQLAAAEKGSVPTAAQVGRVWHIALPGRVSWHSPGWHVTGSWPPLRHH